MGQETSRVLSPKQLVSLVGTLLAFDSKVQPTRQWSNARYNLMVAGDQG